MMSLFSTPWSCCALLLAHCAVPACLPVLRLARTALHREYGFKAELLLAVSAAPQLAQLCREHTKMREYKMSYFTPENQTLRVRVLICSQNGAATANMTRCLLTSRAQREESHCGGLQE